MSQLRAGALISTRELTTIRSKRIQLPDPAGVVHLQFRRYAGCPFCDLHLRSIVQRHQELVAAGIREVVVFQSSSAELLARKGDVPFAVVADPTRRLYAEFGVGSSPRAVLDPRAWLTGARAVTSKRPSLPAGRQQALGLPADFLVAVDGHILACKYGVHAYDQWSSVLAGLALLLALDAPCQLVALVAAMLAGLAATLVTLRWKLSVHTAAAGGAVAVLALTFGPALTLTVPTVVLVAWSRVRLGDHTPAQTLAGAALGGLVATTVFTALR